MVLQTPHFLGIEKQDFTDNTLDSALNSFFFFLHVQCLKHNHPDTHSHCRYPEMSERAGERSKASSKGWEGEMGLLEREARHLKKAFEFGREREQGRER